MLITVKGVITLGTHSFDGGFLADTEDLKKQILELHGQDGITFSGGEPLLQAKACLDIAKFCKEQGLNIWCYTGFTFEELLSSKDETILEFLNTIDVLVDGRFVEEQKDLALKFRGSSNQRLLDVKKSLKQQKAVKRKEKNNYVGEYKGRLLVQNYLFI